MPWKYNSVTIREGRAWTDNNGYQHPSNWSSVWDAKTKADRGLVWEDVQAPFDNRFYSGRDEKGNLVEKSLADAPLVDSDGKAIIDERTGEQEITLGLKSIYIEQTKQTANELLKPTDWMVIRLQEDSSKTLEKKYTDYRAAVRTASATIEAKINDAGDMTAFMALWDTPVKDGEPTGNPPINDWPDVVE